MAGRRSLQRGRAGRLPVPRQANVACGARRWTIRIARARRSASRKAAVLVARRRASSIFWMRFKTRKRRAGINFLPIDSNRSESRCRRDFGEGGAPVAHRLSDAVRHHERLDGARQRGPVRNAHLENRSDNSRGRPATFSSAHFSRSRNETANICRI